MFRFCVIFWSNMSSFTSIWNGSFFHLSRSSGLLFDVLESLCFDSVSFFDQVCQVSLDYFFIFYRLHILIPHNFLMKNDWSWSKSGMAHFFGSLGALDFFFIFYRLHIRIPHDFLMKNDWSWSIDFIFGFTMIFWWRMTDLGQNLEWLTFSAP